MSPFIKCVVYFYFKYAKSCVFNITLPRGKLLSASFSCGGGTWSWEDFLFIVELLTEVKEKMIELFGHMRYGTFSHSSKNSYLTKVSSTRIQIFLKTEKIEGQKWRTKSFIARLNAKTIEIWYIVSLTGKSVAWCRTLSYLKTVHFLLSTRRRDNNRCV